MRAMCIANLVFYHCALERSILLQFTEKLEDYNDKILVYAERERVRERERRRGRWGEGGCFKVKPADFCN